MTDAKDPIIPPSKWLMAMEIRTLFELGQCLADLPTLRQLPKGDGHPVLVFPGFLAGGNSTRLLRYFLKTQGYAPHCWKLGRNYGNFPVLDPLMRTRLLELREAYGRKVSLIGWSLGGIYARELARLFPEHVRLVITMGSPFQGGQTANNVNWLFELCSGRSVAREDPALLERIRRPIPVPSTAIYTRTDGIVSWRCTLESRVGPRSENVEVAGSHCGLGHNSLALAVIGDRLAQREGHWVPFEPRNAGQRPSPAGRTETVSRRPSPAGRTETVSRRPAASCWTSRLRALDLSLEQFRNRFQEDEEPREGILPR